MTSKVIHNVCKPRTELRARYGTSDWQEFLFPEPQRTVKIFRKTTMTDPIVSHSLSQLVKLLEMKLDKHINDTRCAFIIVSKHGEYGEN